MQEDQYIDFFGRQIKQSDAFKMFGLLAFIALMIGVVVGLWPSFKTITEPGGVDQLIADVKSQGAKGVFVLLGLQLLQIVVVVIPGEAVQIAAGMLYGPWWGALLIMIGCVISTALIYTLVNKLGAPFVHAMVSEKHLEKFGGISQTKKFTTTVFILFLLPAFPKDALTYIVPLSNMKMSTFLLITTIGRFPGVLISTYAAAGLAQGEIVQSLIIFAVAIVLALVGFLMRDKIVDFLERFKR